MGEHFRRYQRFYEVAFWVVYLGVNNLVGATSVLTEYRRLGLPLETWKPFAWEFTSALSMGLLVPLVIAFDRRFPITETRLWSRLGIHGLMTVPFSLAHVALMVTMRELVYATRGGNYDFGHWPTELLYEYRKDALSYITILVIIYTYRYLVRRHQGDARFLADREPETIPPSEPPSRLLIRKRGREFVIRVEDVDWVEASGNYVNLHVGERIYPLRDTMKGLVERLDPERFARVHRSAIVNLDRVAEIAPLDSGDYRIRLEDGTEVGFSRRYREAVKSRLVVSDQ